MSVEDITGHHDPQIIRQIQAHGILQEGLEETPLQLAHRLGIICLSNEQLETFGLAEAPKPEV